MSGSGADSDGAECTGGVPQPASGSEGVQGASPPTEHRTPDTEVSPRPPPQRPGPARRLLSWALVALFGLLLAAGAFAWLVVAYPAQPGPGSGRMKTVTLSKPADLAELRLQVGQHTLVRRPRLFFLYAWAMGAGGRLREGPVRVRDDMSPRQLLQRLAHGYGATELRITFPEGLTRFGVGERLQRWGVCTQAQFVAASTDPHLLAELGVVGPTAEGHLFPDTYRIRDDATAAAVVTRLVKTSQARLAELAAEQPAEVASLTSTLGFDLNAVVTLASIVEKEAAVPEEQPVIAGVFLNRLRDPAFVPKRLQADPTVAYGCLVQPELASCASFDGRTVTRTMTADAGNRYNTYRHAGLPPGPIANPGMGALRAVLAPAEHSYFYFVARGGGRHRFSETLGGHNQAVQAYRQGR